MARYRVIVSDQVFPNVDLERRLLGEIGASLDIADGTVEDLRARATDADAVLNTYLPIDAAYPTERTEFMLKDANAAVLLTQSPLLARLPDGAAPTVCLDTFDWSASEEPAQDRAGGP